jgi:hypothetical protein
MRRGDAVEKLNKCCKKKALEGSGNKCPFWSGYSEVEENFMCEQRDDAPSQIVCQAGISKWLGQPDWYKRLSHWEGYEAKLANHLFCIHSSSDVHVNSILLNEQNLLFPNKHNRNPMLKYVQRIPGCSGLDMNALSEAARASYEQDLCLWGIPHDNYKPQFSPSLTCTFNEAQHQIEMAPGKSCPEGHRCACPIFKESEALTQAAFNTTNGYSFAYYGGETIKYGMMGAVALGTASAAAVSTVALPLAVATGVVSVVTFGASYVINTLTHSCADKVGCFPMDCVNVKNIGCRIRPSEFLVDQRNEYWFMPPPTYKCHFQGTTCTLSPCSHQNLVAQRVGIFKSKATFGGGQSGVYNCQPLLVSGMSWNQSHRYKEVVADLKNETEQHLQRQAHLHQALNHACPWKWPMSQDYKMKCKDMNECVARVRETCCDDNQGIQRCPRNAPHMCNNSLCFETPRECESYGRGGLKPCRATEFCPWLEPTGQDDIAECEDGSPCEETSSWWSWGGQKSCCHGKGGVKHCPANRPIMCEEQNCEGDHCCVERLQDCKEGLPRRCDVERLEKEAAERESLARKAAEMQTTTTITTTTLETTTTMTTSKLKQD